MLLAGCQPQRFAKDEHDTRGIGQGGVLGDREND